MVGVGVLAAGWHHVTPPASSKALMFSAFALWAAFFVAEFFIHELPTKRRAYWSTWLGGCALAALAVVHRGWATSVGLFAVLALAGVVTAIRYTPYLKIGGRVIAVCGYDRREGRRAPTPTFPRPLRDRTGPHLWWLLVGLAVFVSLSVVTSGWGWRAYLFGNMLLGMMGLFGFDDGRQRFPILRRQYLQAALVTVVSIPLCGVPVLVYVAAYALGARRPVRYSRHDAEARYYHQNDRLDSDGERHAGNPTTLPPE